MVLYQLFTALSALAIFCSCAFLIGNPAPGPLGIAVGVLLVLFAAALVFLRDQQLSFELVASTVVAATAVVAGVASVVVGVLTGAPPILGSGITGIFVAGAATKFYLRRYGVGGTKVFMYFSIQFMLLTLGVALFIK